MERLLSRLSMPIVKKEACAKKSTFSSLNHTYVDYLAPKAAIEAHIASDVRDDPSQLCTKSNRSALQAKRKGYLMAFSPAPKEAPSLLSITHMANTLHRKQPLKRTLHQM